MRYERYSSFVRLEKYAGESREVKSKILRVGNV